MTMVNIEGKEYEFDSLSSTAKELIQSIQHVDVEMKRLHVQNSILKTARVSYSNALRDELNKDAPGFSGDTIKF